MAVERKFIEDAMKKVKVDLYVHEELKRVGIGNIDIRRTPLGTRVIIEARKPGLVIGRKGKTIQMLTDTLKDDLNVDNPQLEVKEVAVPELDPEIMAKQLAGTLEGGIHFRRASYQMLRRIMESGALGAQIQVSGKVRGTRARSEKFRKGYIKHCGEPANKYVNQATAYAYLKQGIVGIQIKIIPPLEADTLQELALRKPKVSAETPTDETEIIKSLHKTETPEAKKGTKQEKPEEKKEEKEEKSVPKETKKQAKSSAGKKSKAKTAGKKPKTKKEVLKPKKKTKTR